MSRYKYAISPINESKLVNVTPSLLCKVNTRLWQSLSTNQQNQITNLMNEIASGIPYPRLGGKKVKCNHSLVRFHVGRRHRLILIRTSKNFIFKLFNRQNYERNFKKNLTN